MKAGDSAQTPASEAAPDLLASSDREAFERADERNWREVFFDPGTGDWKQQWFLDGEVGKVSNGPDGMTLIAGPEFGNDAHHIVPWTR